MWIVSDTPECAINRKRGPAYLQYYQGDGTFTYTMSLNHAYVFTHKEEAELVLKECLHSSEVEIITKARAQFREEYKLYVIVRKIDQRPQFYVNKKFSYAMADATIYSHKHEAKDEIDKYCMYNTEFMTLAEARHLYILFYSKNYYHV